jgi:Tol biopolymer transport system component
MAWRRARSCGVALVCSAVAIGGCGGADRSLDHAPVLMSPAVTTDEDVPITIRVLDGASDFDGDALRVVDAVTARDQTVEVVDGTVVKVTPQRDFHGMFFVTYHVTDGTAVVAGQASVTVRAVNDAPTARGRTQSVHGKTKIVLDGGDVDGDALQFEIVTPPTNGTLTGVGASVDYEPAAGFVGHDEFSYRVHDAAAASELATIQLQVLAGSLPIAFDGAIALDEDTTRSLTLVATDADLDPLTFTIETPPQHGTLMGFASQFIYTPDRDYSGSDSLTFSASDGYGSSNIATVTITVLPVNDRPVATPQNLTATEDTNLSITLGGSDVETGALTFLALQPQHGTLLGFGATRTYVPEANFHGGDSFTFTVSDGGLTSAPATVTIDVASVEDLPVARPVSLTLSEDNPAVVPLLGSDGDGDPLTYAIAAPPQHGMLSGSPSAPTYRPDRDYNGPDSFSYTVSDGDDTSAPAQVSLTILAVNDDPVAVNLQLETDEDIPVAFTLQATDVDSSALTFTLLTFPIDGTLTGSGANLTYRPARDASGTRSFSYRAHDGSGGFGDATVTIVIHAVNDPPTTVDDFAFTEPGGAVTFTVIDNDSDVEGDPVQLDSVDTPAHGRVEIVDGKLHYTPEAGFVGVDIFAYTAVDSHGAAAIGHAHVGVGTFPPGAPSEAIATIAGTFSATDQTRIPAISNDGRYIVFITALALVSDDTNNVADVYLFDRGTRTVARLSVATDGGQSDGPSFRPQLSPDARYVVFDSLATNLVAGDGNGLADVFRHDRVTGETIRISVASGGAQGTGSSFDAELSDDGNRVVFQSSAFDLIASDTNGTFDVFVRDIAAGTTTRASVTAVGGEADLGAIEPTISGDGRFVAFTSSSTNLIADDTNNVPDIFVRDLTANTTTRVSVSSVGGQANAGCTRASLSHDGGVITFRSAASSLVGGTPPPPQVVQLYARNVAQQTTALVGTAGTFDALWGRLSADGRYVTVFRPTSSVSAPSVIVHDRFSGSSTAIGTSTWQWPMISGNGRYIVVLDSSNGGQIVVAPNPR